MRTVMASVLSILGMCVSVRLSFVIFSTTVDIFYLFPILTYCARLTLGLGLHIDSVVFYIVLSTVAGQLMPESGVSSVNAPETKGQSNMNINQISK